MPLGGRRRNKELAGPRTELQNIVDDITGYKHRMRWVLIAMAACIILSLAATTVAILGVVGNHHQGNATAEDQRHIIAVTKAIHNAQLAECNDANRLRAAQIALWLHLISGSSSPGLTDQIKAFEAFLYKTFAPVDCAKLYPDP